MFIVTEYAALRQSTEHTIYIEPHSFTADACLKIEASIYMTDPWQEISNHLVCATSKGSDQPVHTRRLI